MAKPALDAEKRDGVLDAFGTSSHEPYEVRDEDGDISEVDETPSASDDQAAAVSDEQTDDQTTAASDDDTEEAPAVEAAPDGDSTSEPAATTDEQTEAQSHRDYLDQLLADHEPTTPASTTPPVSDSKLSQLEQQIATLKTLLGDRLADSAERIVGGGDDRTTAPPTMDLGKLKEGMLKAYPGMEEDEAERMVEVLSSAMPAFVEAGRSEVDQLKQKLEALESSTSQANTGAAIKRNLEMAVTKAQKLEGTMAEAVATQFADGVNQVVGEKGDTEEAWIEGFNRSALGRYLLRAENRATPRSAEKTFDAILSVAYAAEHSKRNGAQAKTVLTGTKEEVNSALSRAHHVDPSDDTKAELTPEEQLKADMAAAAKAERGRMASTFLGDF